MLDCGTTVGNGMIRLVGMLQLCSFLGFYSFSLNF